MTLGFNAEFSSLDIGHSGKTLVIAVGMSVFQPASVYRFNVGAITPNKPSARHLGGKNASLMHNLGRVSVDPGSWGQMRDLSLT